MRKMDILLLISIIMFQYNACPSWFNGRDIDYWNENKNLNTDKPTDNKLNEIQGGASIRYKDTEPFDWNNYSTPSKIEFYDDGGDFVPNRPWREVMSNPTKENIERYMAWQSKKIELSNNISKIMSESSGMPIPLVKQPKLDLKNLSSQNEPAIVNHVIKWNTLQVLYFYKSSCHFCQASAPTVAALKEHHVLFIPVQLDWKENPPLYSESVKYDENLEDTYKVKGTPTWVIKRADKSNSEPLTIEGYMSDAELENSIKSIF
jgi:thiol-disulfide isomerase/thioredoxin